VGGQLAQHFSFKVLFFHKYIILALTHDESWEAFFVLDSGGCFYVYKGVSIRVVFVGGCGPSMKTKEK